MNDPQVDGGGWRLPKRSEPGTVHEKKVADRNMTLLMGTTGRYVCSGEKLGSSEAWSCCFNIGLDIPLPLGVDDEGRAFAARSRPWASCPTPGDKLVFSTDVTTYPREIARDCQCFACGNGVVADTKTGLIWAAKDNWKDIDWHDAIRYCYNCRRGGYTDWPMPTLDELEGLHDPDRKSENGKYDLTKLIDLTFCCPWASETKDGGSRATHFNFTGGERRRFPPSNANHRALPVRWGELNV